MFDLVIFDCDGVLVDSEPISNRVLAECLTEFGLPTTPEESMHTYMGRWWPDILDVAAERLGRPLPEGFTETYRSRQLDALARDVRPVPGVVEVLEQIDLPACVASNGALAKMELTLGRCGLLDRFRGRIFSANHVQAGKPAPDLFLHAAGSLGADPARCAVIEDSVLGVRAARAAGMEAYAFHGHEYPSPITREALAQAGGRPFGRMDELPGLLAADPGPAAHGH